MYMFCEGTHVLFVLPILAPIVFMCRSTVCRVQRECTASANGVKGEPNWTKESGSMLFAFTIRGKNLEQANNLRVR